MTKLANIKFVKISLDNYLYLNPSSHRYMRNVIDQYFRVRTKYCTSIS